MDFNWVFSINTQQQRTSDESSLYVAGASLSSNPQSDDLAGANLAAKRATMYSEGDWRGALSVCTDMISVDRKNFGHYIVRANTYLKLGQFQLAIEDCSTAIQLHPISSAAYCTRAYALTKLKLLDEAEADCMKAIELNPNDTVIYSNRSAVYRARQPPQWHKVIEDCTEIIKRKETDASAYTMRGAAYGKLRELDTAVGDCKRAVELAPTDPTSHTNLALVYSMMGKWEKAVHECTQAMIHGQANAGILTPRAVAYSKLRRFELALADLTHAISLDRTHLNAWTTRASILSKLERWAEVVNDCTHILELDPKNLQAHNTRGVAYSRIGNNRQAEKDLTFVVEGTNNMVGKGCALGARAAVYLAVKKWGLAIEDCQRARVLDPQGSERYKVIQLTARDAMESEDKVAKDQAESMMQQLIHEEAIEKQRSVEQKEKKKKKKKKRNGVKSSGSFDALRTMTSTDTANSDPSNLGSGGGTFDEEDAGGTLGLIDYSDGESDVEDALELIAPIQSRSTNDLSTFDEGTDEICKTLFGLTVTDELRNKNTPEVDNRQKVDIDIVQVPRSKLDVPFTPTTPKKGIKNDAVLSEMYENKLKSASKIPEASPSPSVASLISPPPSSRSVPSSSDVGPEKTGGLGLLDMLVFFLPTFPMFNQPVDKQQTQEQILRASALSMSAEEKDGEVPSLCDQNFNPAFIIDTPDDRPDGIDDYGNYLEIMSDTESSELGVCSSTSPMPSRSVSPGDSIPEHISSESLISRKNSSSSNSVVTSSGNLGRITSLNSLGTMKLARSRSMSNPSSAALQKITIPVPTKDDLVSVGKLAFSKAHVIGRGSFGTMVYAGAHVEFGRAAIKAISKEGWGSHKRIKGLTEDGLADKSVDESMNDSFSEQEATPAEVMAIADRKILLMIAQKGTHKSLVRYFGFEEDNNFMYLALELCEVSLWSIFNDKKMMEKRQQFRTPARQQQFTNQLLEGIKFLHTHQIVHGDLRPKNVLFDYNGQLKIADFGLAQKVSFEDDSFSWQHGGPDGFGGWFAPEVYLKERKTMAVDLFSAGCMLFWVVANGVHPFGNNPFNVVQGHYQAIALASNPEISDLVGWMVSHTFQDRPTIDETLKHPFLWGPAKRMQFLTDVGNKIDQFKDLLEHVCWSCGSREAIAAASPISSRYPSKSPISSPASTAAQIASRRWFCRCGGGDHRMPWRTMIPKDLMDSLSRRRKYPSDSTAWFVRFFRNLDQHFHDQTDQGILCLKNQWMLMSNQINMSDENYLVEVRSSATKQRALISEYIKKLFPTFLLSTWREIGPIHGKEIDSM